MRTIVSAPLCALLAAYSGGAIAQTTTAPATVPATAPATAPAPTAAPVLAAQPQAMIVGGAPTNMLRAGTQIPLRMAEELTTKGKKLRVGQRFQLEVAEAVTVEGQIVIPAGSPAVGEITDVRNKGMWGKSGRINARVLFVRANGRQIRMTGSVDDKGTTGTAGVVAAVAFLPVAGFFTTGTSAAIPLGAPVTGFLDEDLTIAFAAPAAPAPMIVVPVAAPAPAPAIQAAPAQTPTAVLTPASVTVEPAPK